MSDDADFNTGAFCRTCGDDSFVCATCGTTENATLRAENARLREALKRYGQHEAYCAFDPPLGVFDLCTCGLSAALTPERT